MSHDHAHSQGDRINARLKVSIGLNVGFTIFEFIIGIFSGSLALVSDAGHNLTDALSLVVSFFANKIAKRGATTEKTYGYGRATILAALFNASFLVLLAFYIFYEAYSRFMYPIPVAGKYVALVAFFGILVNGTVALLFVKNRDDLNMRSAFLGMAFDALASVGALIAGIVIVFTGNTFVDPLVSILIGILLIISAWGVIRDALHILLEGTPEGVRLEEVRDFIRVFPGITGADDLHVWALSSQQAALSCHVTMDDCSLEKSVKCIGDLKDQLKEKFHIEHATIETELVECRPDSERI